MLSFFIIDERVQFKILHRTKESERLSRMYRHGAHIYNEGVRCKEKRRNRERESKGRDRAVRV